MFTVEEFGDITELTSSDGELRLTVVEERDGPRHPTLWRGEDGVFVPVLWPDSDSGTGASALRELQGMIDHVLGPRT